MRNILLITLLSITALFSCKGESEHVVSPEELAKQDSAALHVAVFPCKVCLPLYYAEATGIFQSLDVDIRLMHLSTMEDCDTALMNHRAEVATSDLARLICMTKDGNDVTAIAQMQGKTFLMTRPEKPILNIKKLKERLIALDRHSETDYFSDKLAKEVGLEQLDFFRTQINNHQLRYSMLTNCLYEAAFLDEPYATLAEEMGCHTLWESSKKDTCTWNVLAMTNKTLKDKSRANQASKLIDAYQLAVERMNENMDTLCLDSIIKKVYQLPHIQVDTIISIHPNSEIYRASKLLVPKKTEVETAKQWLLERKWIPATLNTEKITNDILMKKQ